MNKKIHLFIGEIFIKFLLWKYPYLNILKVTETNLTVTVKPLFDMSSKNSRQWYLIDCFTRKERLKYAKYSINDLKKWFIRNSLNEFKINFEKKSTLI